MKSNHNHFNTVWTPGEFPAGTFNDTRCPSVALTAAEQRDAGEAYMAAFFRMHLGGETAFKPYFDGTDVEPDSVEPEDIHTSYHAGADVRLDVNRYLDDTALTTNQLGGAVTKKKVTPFDLCGGPVPQPQFCLPLERDTATSQHGSSAGVEPAALRLGVEEGEGHERHPGRRRGRLGLRDAVVPDRAAVHRPAQPGWCGAGLQGHADRCQRREDVGEGE